MNHSFNIELAMDHSIEEAIMIEHFAFWIQKNQANDKNFFEGCYWTYNSLAAFKEMFPYMSEKKIRTTLDKLKEKRIIKTGNFNKSQYDRTLWYAFDDAGESICRKVGFHLSKTANGSAATGEPIPVTNTDTDTDTNTGAFMPGALQASGPAAIASLVLNDKSLFPVYQKQVDEWATLYPAVNVVQELRNMVGWLNANPSKRKTKTGILRFVNAWLAKEQNRGGTRPAGRPPVNPIHAIPERYTDPSEIFGKGFLSDG